MSSAQHPNDEEHEAPGHAVIAGSGERPRPGDLVIDKDLGVAPEPLVGADTSTALDEDETSTTIPVGPLWAMKARRHTQWHLLASSERHQRLRVTLGSGDEEVHAIDDGRHHAMIAHVIGSVGGDVEYSLLGRLTREHLGALEAGTVPLAAAFGEATEITVCGTAVEVGVESSNVFDVARGTDASEIPGTYLPGSPKLALTSPLEITAY